RIIGSIDDAESGHPLTVEPCGDEPLELDAGDHDLILRPGVESGFDIDRIVLDSDAGRNRAEAVEPGFAVTGTPHGPDSNEITLTGLTPGEPVWVILGQSHNDGWSATIRDGDDLGSPQIVDGYANGWLITPETETLTVDLTFSPQKRVNVALAISALGVLIALGLAIRRPRGAFATDTSLTLDLDLDSRSRQNGFDARSRAVTIAVVGLMSVIVSDVLTGLVIAVAMGLATRFFWARRMLQIAPALLLGAPMPP